MRAKRLARLAVESIVALFVVAMLAGQLLGQPVLLSYVTTGSMQPTLDPGDGFVAVPPDLAGPVEEGDVVVFRAEELHGGGLTTHRVVAETDRGYVTKGDANPFTDQDGDEPPVRDAQVVAVAWRPGGSVLVLPGVGAAVTGTQAVIEALQVRLAVLFGTRALLGVQGLAYLLFAVTAVLYALDHRLGGATRSRSRVRRTGTNATVVAGGLALLVVLSATAAMVVPAGTQKLGVVSAETDAPGLRVVERGTSETASVPVENGGLVPVWVFFEPESDAVAVDPAEVRVPARSSADVALTVAAPPDTGYYRAFVTEHRYLALLPASVTRALYRVHPWLPLLAVDAVLGVGFFLLGRSLLGAGRFRSRRRDAPSALSRLRRRYG